ncbi:hypothetical protein [Gordonia alkanivorans]|uniref:hypothetical protein n=1 Tax=Gordonia alkanivorans TaxID=84096 RepID=UPI001F4E5671|nr:hypothetical protein [Gordonia alkanivorans]
MPAYWVMFVVALISCIIIGVGFIVGIPATRTDRRPLLCGRIESARRRSTSRAPLRHAHNFDTIATSGA